MNEVTYIAPVEGPRMDTTRLEALCGDLGPRAAENVVCRAMEELGTRLCLAHEQACDGRRDELVKGLRTIRAIALQLGLSGVAQVALDVLVCIEFGDHVGEAATLARLSRMGERSLSALWDLRDLSI